MKIRAALVSDIGRVREINQDNFYFYGKINQNSKNKASHTTLIPKKKGIFGIFDGMGGEQEGERASAIAAEKMDVFRESISKMSFEGLSQKYIESANQSICNYMNDHPDISMGTTAVIFAVDADNCSAVGANVGDSKIFLVRRGTIKRLSKDHNLASELVSLGVISENEAYSHKDKNKLTQYLGIYDDEFVIEPYITDEVMLECGDCFIICTDGLTDGLTTDRIVEIASQEIGVDNKCKELVEAAMEAGSTDNITVAVIEIFK